MTLAIEGSAITGHSGSPLTIDGTAIVAAGRLMIEISFCPLNDITFGTGGLADVFTPHGSDSVASRWGIGRKTALGSETNFVVTSAAQPIYGALWAISGFDTATPLESFSEATNSDNFNATTFTCRSINSTVANSMHFLVYQDSDSDNSVANDSALTGAGYAKLFEANGAGTLAVYWKLLGAPGATGTKSMDWTTNGIGVAYSFIVRPAADVAPASYQMNSDMYF